MYLDKMNFEYLGRETFRDLLQDALRQGSVLLEGPRGVGKTTVLRHWEEHPPEGTTVLRFDLQGVDSATQLRDRMAKHAALARNRLEGAIAQLLGDWEPKDPWESLLKLLLRAPKPCVVLFDEVQLYLDHLARTDRELARRELVQLDGLRRSSTATFVLTGSISLVPIARSLGEVISPDWRRLPLPALEPAPAKALFHHRCDAVCGEVVLTEAIRITAGYPRWIERLATETRCPAGREATLEDLEAGIERLLTSNPFVLELRHVRRSSDAGMLDRALRLAAIPGTNRNALITALQQAGSSRQQAIEILLTLREAFFLDEHDMLALPLFQRALQRQA